MTFTNTIILTSGISLNQFEFPPHSGVNVASDNGGPISIAFSTPVNDVGAYFTYSQPVTIDAYNSANALIGSATSIFSNNEAMSGVPGSTPNEFIAVSSTQNIADIQIIGNPSGGSFAMDDLTYSTNVVPLPSSWTLLASSLLLLVGSTKIARRSTRAN